MSAAAGYLIRRTHASYLLAMACIATAGPGAIAQGNNPAAPQDASAPAQLPAFDVASVKPRKDEGIGHMNVDIWMTPDGITASGVPLSMLIREAFGVTEDRLLNVPSWANSSRYDIEAKVAPEDAPKLKTLSPQQRWEMLLPVFEDRFGLKFHSETVNLQTYTLMVPKGGPKMTAAKSAQPGEDAPQPRMIMRRSTQGLTLECHAVTMASLAQTISGQLGATVVDRTELTGNYDFTLTWMPDEGAGPTLTGSAPIMMKMPAAGTPPDGGTSQEGSGPSLFTALEEQLGLKLEARKQPVDAIVIDHIEQPSPN
jgi:uncharacterized protein (TIGR03435 family)